MTEMRKSAPVDQTGADPRRTAVISTSSVADPDAVDILNGVFVVLVTHKVSGQIRYRRRTFFDLRSAQRHADRLTERGHTTSVTLCRLAPVHTFGGDL